MGEAHHLAHRYGQARVEAVAGLARRTGTGGGLRPYQIRPPHYLMRLEPTMPRQLLTLALACAISACAATAHPPAGAAPSPPPSGGPTPTAPAPTALHIAPGTSRFLIRQDLMIHQDFTGLPPTMTFGMGVFLTAAIAAPADSLGYQTTFTVDSMVVDSGSTLPPGVSPVAARGLR